MTPKSIIYGLLSSALAYVLIALALILVTGFVNGWGTIGNDMVPGLTLTLSEFKWWGNAGYVAPLIPWLGSAVVIILSVRRYGTTAMRRRLLTAFSIFIYYFIMLLYLLIAELAGHGEIRHTVRYDFIQFTVWLPTGFIMGYLSAMIADKIVPYPVTGQP
jgi:hypothetical protein